MLFEAIQVVCTIIVGFLILGAILEIIVNSGRCDCEHEHEHQQPKRNKGLIDHDQLHTQYLFKTLHGFEDRHDKD